MKTHDNQKPYHCTECSRSYNTTAALTSHMQSHAHKRPRNSTHNTRQRSITDNENQNTSRFNSESPLTTESPLMNLNFPLNSNIGFNNSSKSIMIDSPKVQCLQSSMILRCMHCTRDNFTTIKQLQQHVQAMHERNLNVNSNSPDRIRHQNDNRKTHYARHSTNNDCQELSCSLCNMRFKHLATLRNHLITAHYDVQFETNFDCPLCGISCSSTASYAEHYVLVHCENKNIVTEEKNIPKIDQTQEQKSTESNNIHNKIDNYSSTTLLCGQCDAALQDFESFRTHLASHLHLNEQKKNHINCPKCELKFEDRENMLSHLSKHYMGQMIEQYICDMCKKYYPSVESLQKHLLDTHTHLKCALCCDTFDSVLAIQMHFTMKHVNECSMYHCNSCTLTQENEPGGINFFKSISDFINHVENIHVPLVVDENETELSRNDVSTSGGVLVDFFRCCFCGEGFTVEFLLEKHIAHSHNVARDTENQEKEKVGRITMAKLINQGFYIL